MSQQPQQGSAAGTGQANVQAAQLQRLTALLQLEKQIRTAATETELGFVAVNESHRVVNYQQAVLWMYKQTGGVRIEAVSGVMKQDRSTPYMIWLREVIEELVKKENARSAHFVGKNDLPAELHDGWDEWYPEHMMWCPLLAPDGNMLGGMVLSSAEAWQQGQEAIMLRIAETVAHAWVSVEARKTASLKQRLFTHLPNKKIQLTLLLVFISIMFLPVSLTVLAPATVIAESPIVVSAPVDGVIKSISVRPNQQVSEGQLLFTLDDTTLQSRKDVAEKSLEVARADYLRAAQKAFTDVTSKSELAMLEAQVEEKRADLEYNIALLERIKVHAEENGIVIFTDANDWIGKPLTTGEKVMTLANPENTEIEAWVPVADAITLERGAKVRMFLNTDPVNPLDAELYQTSYEAELTPEGVLAFRVKARFAGENRPRVGLKGTAKIYGDKVSLFYYLMRRPLAAARQFLGL
jgi:multidrug resistance efflux pump